MEKEFRERVLELLKATDTSATSLAPRGSAMESKIVRQIKGNSAIVYEVIELIINSFPDVSLEWLFRGNGDMWRSVCGDVEREIESTRNDLVRAEEINRMLSNQIDAQTRIIALQEELLKTKRGIIGV